ncbi:MAG: oligosaccharide flippase family protein, partial [Paracoccaceae bacterium]
GLISLAVSQVAVSATAFVVAFWVAGWRPGFSGRFHHLKELCGYTIFASGDRMLGTLRVDHLVAGALGGSAFLGLLTFAQRFFRMLADLASGAIGSVTHVVLSSMQGEKEKARKTFFLASFAAATIGFPTFAGAALIIDDIMDILFGSKWLAAQTATQIFCLSGFLATPGIIQGALIRSQGRPNWWFYYELVQQFGTVLVIAATYQFGITAVVAGIFAKTFMLWPISLFMTVKILECRIVDYLSDFVGPMLATAGMAGVLYLLPMYPGWFGVAIYIALGAVIYAGFLVMCCSQKLSNILIQMKKAKRA